MELTLMVNEWLRRIPKFDVAPGDHPEIVLPAYTFALGALPLRFTPR